MRIPRIQPDPYPPHRPASRAVRGLLAILTFVIVFALLFPYSCGVADCFGYPGCEDFEGCWNLLEMRAHGPLLYVIAPMVALLAGIAVAFLPRPSVLRHKPDADR